MFLNPVPVSSSSVLLLILLILHMAASLPTAAAATAGDSSAAAVHIVYTEGSHNQEPETYHIRILTSLLGSEEAAKETLVYSYKNAASGFSAKLTPEQVEQISKQPGVLRVVPDRILQLHSEPRKLQ